MKNTISNLQRYDLIGADSDLHIGPESCGDYVKYADVQAALQYSESSRAISDAVTHGTGITKGGKHVPLEDFYVQHAGQGEAARETLASWMLSRGFSTGHGDTIDDLLTELDGQVRPQPAGKETDK